MFEDLDFEWGYIPATLILWGTVVVGLWFIKLDVTGTGGGFGFLEKSIITIVALPITYVIVSIVANK